MADESSKTKRILLVAPLPPPSGGIATWTRTLLDRGLPGNFALYVVDTRVRRAHFTQPARPTPAEIRRTYSILSKVWSAVRTGDYSAVHITHPPHMGIGVLRDYIVARIAAFYGVPVVVQIRGPYDPTRLPSGIMGFLQRMAYRGMFGRAAAILPLDMRSGHAVGETSPQSHDKIRVMPNFIVCSSVPSKLSSDGSSGPLKIVFVGTLIREKNIHVLLELARRVDGISLTLVGHSSPQMVAEINELIQRDGLHDRLHLAGEMPNDEVRKFIAGQDVCILPSFTEGFPMSVLEAMAIGLPIVASPAGALPDMIDVPEGGFLVEPDDIEGFVEAMIKLRDDRPTAVAMGSYNRERALRDYDYDVVARQLVDLYSGLAERTDIRQGSGR